MTAKRRSLASFEATSVLFFALVAGGAVQAVHAQTPSVPRGTSTTPSTTSTTSTGTRTSQITPAEAPSQAKAAAKPEAPKM